MPLPARPLALAALLASCGGAGTPSGTAPPSVVLVSIDSLRADHVGCYGYGRDTTPNLDRLAREGVQFQSQVSSTSWTLPAHTALFTGVPDSVHGCVDAVGTALSEAFETLAERFSAGGYRTAGFYAGPYLDAAFGLGQGFEVYRYCGAGSLDPSARDRWGNDPAFHEASHSGVTNDRVWSAAAEWLDAHDSEPFFLFLHLWDVHYDFTPPAEWATRFDPGYDGWVDGTNFMFDPRIAAGMDARDLQHLIALYDGEIGWTDTFLGLLRARLEQRGLVDRTVVAVTADHGTEFFEHRFKGHRRTLFDEVLRVPFVLWAPGRLPAGARVADQTRSIDVAPTLLALAGLTPPEAMLGHSLLDLARGAPLDFDNAAFTELRTVGLDLRSVRTLKDKLIRDERQPDDPQRWFDLDRDTREQRPLRVEEGRGAEVQARFLRVLGAVERAAAQRPGGPVTPALSEDLRGALQGLGYLGGTDGKDD